jgi:hypothetical protein
MQGRAAVMELLEVNDEIEELILNEGSEEAIYKAARKNGFVSMKEDAIIKALNHVIPYEEIGIFGSDVIANDGAEEQARRAVQTIDASAADANEVSHVPDIQTETLDELAAAPVDNRHL